jgi:hypothetical protein
VEIDWRCNPVKLTLTVDGQNVETNPFVRNLFTNVLVAMVASLKGVDDPKKIVLEIREE